MLYQLHLPASLILGSGPSHQSTVTHTFLLLLGHPTFVLWRVVLPLMIFLKGEGAGSVNLRQIPTPFPSHRLSSLSVSLNSNLYSDLFHICNCGKVNLFLSSTELSTPFLLTLARF
jgi:hypothetical protein